MRMAENAENFPLLPPLINGEMKKNERPKEPWKGEFVKSIVYAGLDAIVTSFSLISISAGRLSSVDVLVLGFANLVADGFSMGFGDFVSSMYPFAPYWRRQCEQYGERRRAKERSIAKWDVENEGGNQREELVRRYQELGMNASDAAMVVSIFGKYPELLLDEKMATEKGMLPPDQSEKPWKNGLITFVAFIVFGCAPILAFIILIPFTNNDQIKFAGACVLSALVLALLGLAKARFAGQNYTVSMGIMLFNGAVAGAAAYGIGWALRNVAGLDD